MRLIKLFEQYVKEEAEMAGMPVSNIAVNPQTLLDNKSTEFNRAIGVKKLPSSYSSIYSDNFVISSTIADGVYPNEVDSFVNALDFPMGSDDPGNVKQWLIGNGFPGILGGSGEYGALKNRVVNEDGLWYPAVEHLRVQYNLDESFETLGSSVSKPELAEAKKLLLECYECWISRVNANSNKKVQSVTAVTNEGVNVVPKGKSDLIQELRNKLINFEKKNEFDAMAIARLIYNDCADFMNKASIYSDKTKYGEPVAQPAAQSAPTNIIGTDTAAPGIADVIDPSKAPIAPVNPQ